jgi:hypothetical protein
MFSGNLQGRRNPRPEMVLGKGVGMQPAPVDFHA